MATAQTQSPERRRRLWAAFVAVNIGLVILILAAVEGLIVVALSHPPPVHLVRRVLSGYYQDFDRAIVQMMPECARYDAELGYTLRPGTCRFKNRDFDTEIRVNSMGLRDGEDSLLAPEIIVLGDSFAMGWGVEDAETFAKLLQRMCGMKVLNAGISSYGTAREIRLLERLDRTALKWLIIQYNDNDYGENLRFLEGGSLVAPMSEQDYLRVQDREASRRSYYPGKHVIQFTAYLGQRIRNRMSSETAAVSLPAADNVRHVPLDNEASVFLDVLSAGPTLSAGVSVLAFELNGASRNDSAFAGEVRTELVRGSHAETWRSMQVLDLAPLLSLDHFFALDEHLSALGHRTVAGHIARTLGCSGDATAGGVIDYSAQR